MVDVALISTFDSPKVAKARLPLPGVVPTSFFAYRGDILFGHLVTFSMAAFSIFILLW